MDDSHYLQKCIVEAKLAEEHDDVPVGAIVVKDGVILAKAHNRREVNGDPSAHAEILALRTAATKIGSWNLTGCTLYSSLEPCVMCAGALVQARVARLIYAATDPKGGAISLEIPILNNQKLNHQVESVQGPHAKEAGALLTAFFQRKRLSTSSRGIVRSLRDRKHCPHKNRIVVTPPKAPDFLPG